MARDTMTDHSAIVTKLAVLAANNDVFSDGHRVITHDLQPLTAILREIDDTVLERTLIFGIGDTTVSAVVAGRRLRGIVAMTGDVPGMEDIVGQALSHEDPETLAAVGGILAHLCANDPKVTVNSAPVQPIGSAAEAGVSMSVLARAWGVDLDARPASPLARLLAANAAQITASLHIIDGQTPVTTGDATVLEAIQDVQVIPFRKRHKSVLGKMEGPMLVCLEGAVGGAPVALAVADGEQCLFIYQSAGLPDLLASWNAITGA